MRLVDSYPTILSALGLDLANQDGIDGRNLLPLLQKSSKKASEDENNHESYSETVFEIIEEQGVTDISSCFASLRTRSWKLIWDRLDDSQELYRIDLDPGEKNDLASSKPEVVNQLLPRMQELAGEMPVAGLLSAEVVMIKRLEALGYL